SDLKLETFRLQQQAMMQRTDGPRVIDEVHGSDILYESRSEFFTVEGTSGNAATAGNPSGRVRVVIQPREDPKAPPKPADAPAGLKPAERLSTPSSGSR
ncbi:MAG: hypothetical protein AB7S98_04495, partial [Burkholderiaceae bacterium]